MDPATHAAEPQWDPDKRVWRSIISSQYQKGPNPIEVLLPETFDRSKRYRVLYVLPVERGIGGHYGDGLAEVRATDAHNRHDLICVQMAFDTVPWFMDHAFDPQIRQESYLRYVVLPLIERWYPTSGTAEGRLLLGFSKSGWGAFTLLLRNPGFYGYAASWDAPLMLEGEDWDHYGIPEACGTVANFAKYQPGKLLTAQAARFQGPARFALLGEMAFGSGGMDGYTGPHTHTVWAHATMQRLGIKHVYHDDLRVSHDWHSGWVSPAIDALMSLGPISDS